MNTILVISVILWLDRRAGTVTFNLDHPEIGSSWNKFSTIFKLTQKNLFPPYTPCSHTKADQCMSAVVKALRLKQHIRVIGEMGVQNVHSLLNLHNVHGNKCCVQPGVSTSICADGSE